MKKWFYSSFIVLLCTVLIACSGWHLRGHVALSEKLRLLAIAPDNPYDPLQQELRDVLYLNDVNVVSIAAKPTAILQLENEHFTITELVIDRAGQPTENKLHYTITLTVVDSKGDILAKKQTVNVERYLRYNPNYLLSSQEEEKLVEKAMRKDVVNQMMRRLEKVE